MAERERAGKKKHRSRRPAWMDEERTVKVRTHPVAGLIAPFWPFNQKGEEVIEVTIPPAMPRVREEGEGLGERKPARKKHRSRRPAWMDEERTVKVRTHPVAGLIAPFWPFNQKGEEVIEVTIPPARPRRDAEPES